MVFNNHLCQSKMGIKHFCSDSFTLKLGLHRAYVKQLQLPVALCHPEVRGNIACGTLWRHRSRDDPS